MTDSELTQVPAAPRRSPLRRIGCTVALIVWFALLLVPYLLIIMATQGEITIAQGSLPGQQIRVWLIMEANERGLGVSSTSARQTDPNAACVQTDTRFLLWSGSAEPLSYCECYARADADSLWTSVSTEAGVCP
jgi:hypothetical protein